jgi:hypothetical protein
MNAITNKTPLDETARTLSTPDEWTIEHNTPNPYSTTNDEAEHIRLTHANRFHRSNQTHDERDVTGFRVIITDQGSTLNDDTPYYDVTYTLMLNDVEFGGKRVVHYAGLEESIEWAMRLIGAVEDTPSRWVMLPASAGVMNRWATVDGSREVHVCQEDRNNMEPRQYRVLDVTPRIRRRDGRKIMADGVRTSDLYTVVTDHIAI